MVRRVELDEAAFSSAKNVLDQARLQAPQLQSDGER